MMKLHHLLMGTALAFVPAVSATAQNLPQGPYIASQIGVDWLKDATFESATATNKVDTKEAITATLGAGYQFATGLRLGVEGGYNIHQVDKVKGGPAGNYIGDLTTFTLMGVVQKEFDTGTPFRPYVGAGVGWGWVDTDNVGPVFTGSTYSNGQQDNLAYQLSAGVSYALTSDLDLTLGYRFLAIDDLKFKSETPAHKSDYASHSVLIGVRAVFGSAPVKATPVAATVVAPPPPPPPAPAPVAAPAAPTITRNFTVFFDWDRSVLSADAQQVLQNVARDAKAGKIVQINISGHADTSGPADYNQKLSLRRADAVREYLASQGLPASQIAVEAKGESDLLVPTADGVREPSNRRAVIMFP